MPSVASEATTLAFKPALPNPAPTAQNSDQSQDLPFASLLAGAIPASSDQPAPSPPAAGGIIALSTWLDSAQLPAQNGDPAPPDANAAQSGAKATPAAAGLAAVVALAVSVNDAAGATKVGFDVKISKQTAAGEGAKPADDGKPADGLTPDDPAAVSATGPVQTVPIQAIITAAAITPAPLQAPGTIAPTAADATTQPAPAAVAQAVPDSLAQGVPDEAPQTKAGGVAPAVPAIDPQAPPAIVLEAAPVIALQAAPAAVPQAALAAKRPATVATAASEAESTDFAASQADTGKPAGDPNSPAKTSFASQDAGKAPATADDADKPAGSRSHDETAASPHYTATAETPPAADAQAATPKAAVDAVQQTTLTPPSHNAAPAAANPAAPTAPATATVPLAGIAVEIAGKALAGKNRFEIRLDPPELGRIEVRLDVGHDGQVTSTLIADRSDTLDLLRRDSAGLERALQDAGLKTSDNGLQFSLRDQGTGRDQAPTPTPAAAQLVVTDDTLAAIDTNSGSYGRLAGLGGGIDIRV